MFCSNSFFSQTTLDTHRDMYVHTDSRFRMKHRPTLALAVDLKYLHPRAKMWEEFEYN